MARAEGLEVSQIHVRHIWPLPSNMEELLSGFDHVMVPEMNNGQFATILRDQFLIDTFNVNQVNGQPFKVSDLVARIKELA
jgi:2-oxoglutarate ferredoxin oxidoreductase subunit alpha